MLKKTPYVWLKFLILILLINISTANSARVSISKAISVANFSYQQNFTAPPNFSIHYIAPAPWQYWNKANEIIITTTSTTAISGKILKSDSTLVTTFTVSNNNPFIYRFTGLPLNTPQWPMNTVVSGAGLFVSADAPIAVNLRNVASDSLGADGDDSFIKGNASLFSFGDAAIGLSFRVGYYRDGVLSDTERPVYSVMALEDNTIVTINGVATATLNKGQSYLFQENIGALVETSGLAVMNTSARVDAPGGCGDGAYNPIPPISSLGNEYVIVRGEGNKIAEQTTIIATEPNTSVTVQHFDINGDLRGTETFPLATAGSFVTFNHGYLNGEYNASTNTGRYSSSRIVATKNVGVFSGTAGASGGAGCEVDVATLVPISLCSGSRSVETVKFTAYDNSDLDYFGYILTSSAQPVFITTLLGTVSHTNVNIETLAGTRKPLAGTNLYLIKFTKENIGSPKIISINSATRITVSMVQQSSAFSMSNFISRFPEQAEYPSMVQTDCTSALLKANANSVAPFQWYLDGVAIPGATASTYTATASGRYSITSLLDCGTSATSLPVTVDICNIDRAIQKTVNVAYPTLNSNVVFTLVASNLGNGNASGVSVKDLLPAGYQFVSQVAAAGTSYDALSGIWTIGNLNANTNKTLKITAKVVLAGTHVNTATILGQQPDNNTGNDVSSATTTTDSPDRVVCIGVPIEDIIVPINNNTGLVVTGLPTGVTHSYSSSGGSKRVIISGTPTVSGVFNYSVSNSSTPAKTGVITVNRNVLTPVFNTGLVDTRCVGAGTNTYTATATYASSMVYSLLPLSAGSINATTGVVTWAATFTGQATIVATAMSCSPKQQTYIVNVMPLPSLTVADTEICEGILNFDLVYVDPINAPISYSIRWPNNEFANTTNLPLPANIIPVQISNNPSLGLHQGIVTVVNAAGCTQDINFTVNIKPKPVTPNINLITHSDY